MIRHPNIQNPNKESQPLYLPPFTTLIYHKGILCRSSAADWRSTTVARLYATGRPRDHYCAILETTTKPGPRGFPPRLMWSFAWVWPSMNQVPWIKLPTSALEIHWKVNAFSPHSFKFPFFLNLCLQTLIQNPGPRSVCEYDNINITSHSSRMWVAHIFQNMNNSSGKCMTIPTVAINRNNRWPNGE